MKNSRYLISLIALIGLSGCIVAPKKTMHFDEHCDFVREKTEIDVQIFGDDPANRSPIVPGDLFIPVAVAATTAAFSSAVYIYDNAQDSIAYKQNCKDTQHSNRHGAIKTEPEDTCSGNELCEIERTK
ncbi:hypothetical protein [Pseudoalteromonas obscura]|uniref:Lipoprotein n=1 Tax=Pseudoalteromonas obscura TaxID=3048491 RepID=A0ABT7ENT9_9GAMM|nr:hypothetical protein [Pseudoalteromonas sp. P94(2023)]MDK2596715.1 hypothetical protein [Pseudoalteromonas sp. P94(2023)]